MTGYEELKNRNRASDNPEYTCIDSCMLDILVNKESDKYISKLSATVKESLEFCETHTRFFSVEGDLTNYVPKSMQEDFFYTLKRKKVTKEYPARFLYVLDFMKEREISFNEIQKFLTEKQLAKLSSALPEGISLEDVIKNHYDSKFRVLHWGDRINRGEYSEVKIPVGQSGGRVAFINNSILRRLSDSDIMEIEQKNKILMLRGKPIASLGGSKYGVTKGTYDLRRVL